MVPVATVVLSDIHAKIKRSRVLVAESRERIERTEILMDMSQSAVDLTHTRTALRSTKRMG